MTMADREARMLAAIYRTYGLAALWTPADGGEALAPVVRRDTRDVQEGFGAGESLMRSNLVFVRTTDFVAPAAPALDDQIEITRPGGGVDTFRVMADPRLEPNGLEWLCEVKALDA